MDIVFLQELWQPNQEVRDLIPGSPLLKLRNQNKGGGSLSWLKNISFKINRTIHINSDFSLHRILLGRDKFIWIASVYLSVGSPAQIKALFRKLYDFVPSYEWKYLLLVGDFNVNLKIENLAKKTLLTVLAKQFGLKLLNSNQLTSHSGELDFLSHGSAINIKFLSLNKAPSDHKLLIWELQLPCPETQNKIKIPNKYFAETATKLAWHNSRNTKEFLRYI